MLGMVVLAVGGAIYSIALASLRRHEDRQPAWWFGYARDAVNMASFLFFSGGFRIAGMPGHLALLAGASLTLAAYGLDYLLARGLSLRHAGVLHGALLATLSAISGLAARPLERGLAALVRGLF